MIQHFIAELQRRKVLRVATGYVVAAWIILQVAVAVQTAWALSAGFSGTILSLLVIGFPAAVGLAWFFEITPQGIKRTAASKDGMITKLQTTDFVLVGALALVFCIGVAQFVWPREAKEATATAAPKTATTDTSSPKVEPPRLGDKSIAVLPFANLSKEGDDAVFADGLTEAVLDVLSRVRGLRVISRTSSFAFKGKSTALPEIARQLGVRHVLEGSIRRDGDSVRVTAQLIDVTSDTHLWSQTFERSVADVFAAQDDIARAVGRALNFEISVTTVPRGAPTKNLDAYRLYLKGREEYIELTKAGVLSSIDLLRRAIALDPDFAAAHGQLAWAYGATREFDPASWSKFQPLVRSTAEAALKLDPKLASAIAVQSGLARRELDWAASLALARKAVEIEPSNSQALVGLGLSELITGNSEKAQKVYEEIDRVDPLFGGGPLGLLLSAFARGDDAATVTYANRLRTGKGLYGFVALFALACLAQEQGDHASAVEAYKRLAAAAGRASLAEPVTAALKSPSARGKAVRALKAEASRDRTFDPLPVYILIGAYDQFFEAANELVRTDDVAVGRFAFFVWHVVARGQGSNPKLKLLFRSMGLVDYWKKHGWPDRCRAKGGDDFECS